MREVVSIHLQLCLGIMKKIGVMMMDLYEMKMFSYNFVAGIQDFHLRLHTGMCNKAIEQLSQIAA